MALLEHLADEDDYLDDPDEKFFETVNAEALWRKFRADHSDDFRGLSPGEVVVQIKGQDLSGEVFNDLEIHLLENATIYSDFDNPISSALKRSRCSAMKVIYRAIMRAGNKPGLQNHKIIGKRLMDVAAFLSLRGTDSDTFSVSESCNKTYAVEQGPESVGIGIYSTSPIAHSGGATFEYHRSASMFSATCTDGVHSKTRSQGYSAPVDPVLSTSERENLTYLFLDEYILIQGVSLGCYEELANKLGAGAEELRQASLFNRDNSAAKRADLKQLLKRTIIRKKIGLYELLNVILESDLQLRKRVFHSTSTNPCLYHFSHDNSNPLWSCLLQHLPPVWEQFANRIGFPADEIVSMKEAHLGELVEQVKTFLNKLKLPRLDPGSSTFKLVCEMLRASSLPHIAQRVARDLNVAFEAEMSSSESIQDYLSGDHIERRKNSSRTAEGMNFLGDPDQSPQRSSTSSCKAAEACSKTKGEFQSGHLATKPASLSVESESGNTAQGHTPDAAVDATKSGTFVTSHSDPKVVKMIESTSVKEEAILAVIEEFKGLIVKRESDGKQAIHAAAKQGYVSAITALIDQGYSINAQMKDGSTPVLLAVRFDRSDAFEKLLTLGADLTLCMSMSGMTPFLIACQYGYFDYMLKILENNQNIVQQRDTFGRSCLHFPAVLQNCELLAYLIHAYSLDVRAVTPQTKIPPLSVACAVCEYSDEPIRILLKNTTKLKDVGGRMPPIHIAAFSGNLHVTKLLIKEYNANVNEKNEEAFTALHLAASMNQMPIVEYLIEAAGAEVDAKSKDSSTPLTVAVTAGHLDIVKYLVNKGADIENLRVIVHNMFHVTPLAEAVLGNHFDITQFLLEKGANYKFLAGGRWSVLAHACIGGDMRIIQLLLQKLECTGSPSHSVYAMPIKVSMDFNDPACARYLLERLNINNRQSFDGLIKSWQPHVESDIFRTLANSTYILDYPSSSLPNEGANCRRTAGNRHCMYYHICYDDDAKWATEIMKMALMFADFRNLVVFRQCHSELFAEICKCLVQTVLEKKCNGSVTYLSMFAKSPAIGAFYESLKLNEEFSLFDDTEKFIEAARKGNPMGLVCQMTSKEELMESSTSDTYSINVHEYYVEMARRDEYKQGQFRLQFGIPSGYCNVSLKGCGPCPFRSPTKLKLQKHSKRAKIPHLKEVQKTKRHSETQGFPPEGSPISSTKIHVASEPDVLSMNSEPQDEKLTKTAQLECTSDYNDSTTLPSEDVALPYPEVEVSTPDGESILSSLVLAEQETSLSDSASLQEKPTISTVNTSSLQREVITEQSRSVQRELQNASESEALDLLKEKIASLEKDLTEKNSKIKDLTKENENSKEAYEIQILQLKPYKEAFERERKYRAKAKGEAIASERSNQVLLKELQKVMEDRFRLQSELNELKSAQNVTNPVHKTNVSAEIVELNIQLEDAMHTIRHLQDDLEVANQKLSKERQSVRGLPNNEASIIEEKTTSLRQKENY